MKRRDFLKITGPLASAPIILNSVPVRGFATSDLTIAMDCSSVQERALVIIKMNGGNDGINTTIPLSQYHHYVDLRPDIALPDRGPNGYLKIPDYVKGDRAIGLHPKLAEVRELYQEGMVSILQGVGYPNQNRSHFKSMDLWMTGGDGTEDYFNLDSGWMARYLEAAYPGVAGNPTPFLPDPLGIQLGSSKPSTGFHTPREHAVALNLAYQNPAGFYSTLSEIGGPGPLVIPDTDYGREIQYIMNTQNNTSKYAERITNVFNKGYNLVDYPNLHLANQLKTVARLIAGGSRTKIFLVEYGGFDTHVNQVDPSNPAFGPHGQLMEHLSKSIHAFYQDLKKLGLADRVMAVTFSEFGRKAEQNGNFGTDHGTLSSMFVFGAGTKPGVYGKNVDLSRLQGGAPFNMQIDYRRVFSTILQDWLGASNETLQDAGLLPFMAPKLPLVETAHVGDPAQTGCSNDGFTMINNIGETGKIAHYQSTYDGWSWISFQKRYVNPVVVVSPPTFQGYQPCFGRIRNVSETGFEFQVREWNYLDGTHYHEYFSYIALEAGEHFIGNRRVVAGRATVSGDWDYVRFPRPFGHKPMVFSQIASDRGTDFAQTRVRWVKNDLFQMKVQEEDLRSPVHIDEIAFWIAVEPGINSEGLKMEAGSTGNIVNHDWYKLDFQQTYANNAIFLADLNSFNDGDSAVVRIDGFNGESVRVFLQEDTSVDEELVHNNEELAYWVMDGPSLIREEKQSDETVFTCPETGFARWEVWLNRPGHLISTFPENEPYDRARLLDKMEIPPNRHLNYASRLRGWLCPPISGRYTFWLSSDNQGELYLSSDWQKENKRLIAHINDWTGPREWGKYPEQVSVPIYLEKGNLYYIEARNKQSTGGDNLSVGWKLPTGELDRPISGKYIMDKYIPLVPAAASVACATLNLSLAKPAFASTYQTESTLPGYAVDGSLDSAWESKTQGPEWIYLDLQETYDICQAHIYWIRAPRKYRIQVGRDVNSWETVRTVEHDQDLNQVKSELGSQGRFFRLAIDEGPENGTTVLKELTVYGSNPQVAMLGASEEPEILHEGILPLTINCYPNPIGDHFHVALGNAPVASAQIEVSNMRGQRLFATTTQQPEQVTAVNSGHYPPGMYIVRVTSGEQVAQMRVVKD